MKMEIFVQKHRFQTLHFNALQLPHIASNTRSCQQGSGTEWRYWNSATVVLLQHCARQCPKIVSVQYYVACSTSVANQLQVIKKLGFDTHAFMLLPRYWYTYCRGVARGSTGSFAPPPLFPERQELIEWTFYRNTSTESSL